MSSVPGASSGSAGWNRRSRLPAYAQQTHIAWRPFQLNPTMPKEGMDRHVYLDAKFGSLERSRQMEVHVLAAGVAERIPFAFEKVAWTPNYL